MVSIFGCIVSLAMFKESNYIQYIFVLLGKFRGLIGPFEMNQSPCYYKTKDYKSIELGNTVDKLLIHRTQLSESKMFWQTHPVLPVRFVLHSLLKSRQLKQQRSSEKS